MNQKNLSVKNKIHKSIFNTLKDKKLFKLFKKFEDSIDLRDKFAVAVSGGPDSLCLAFLSKCFAIKNII